MWVELYPQPHPLIPKLPLQVPLIATGHGALTDATEDAPAGETHYIVYGAAVAEVEVDVLTGDRQVRAVCTAWHALHGCTTHGCAQHGIQSMAGHRSVQTWIG